MLIDVKHFISTKLAPYSLPGDKIDAVELRLMLTEEPEAVVRCKDCKHYEGDWWVGDCHHERWGDGWVNYPPPRVTEDGFCAWGERREDG